MEQQDGQVPAPRRPGLPRLRRPAPPAPTAPPRVADLSALLADIDALRTTLSTDLSLAAAALEAGADDLAGELVSGDLEALHRFEARSLAHLASLDVPVAADDHEVTAPVVPLRRRRMLSAAPLVAAAAAAVGLFAGVVPSGTPSPAPSAAIENLSQANYSLAMLNDLAERGAGDGELRDAARSLNADLADLVAEAGDDPVAAQQALTLLQSATQVLVEQGGTGAQGPLADVLARTRELEAELRRLLPRAPRDVTPVPPSVTELPRTVTRPAEPEPEAEPAPRQEPAPQPAPQKSQAPAPKPSPTPAPPKPSSSPTPAPAGSPSPDPFPGFPGL